MITREQLIVGQTYHEEGFTDKTILYIGDRIVLYQYATSGNVLNESSGSIQHALSNFSLIPKPKEMIELAMFISIMGDIIETQIDSDRYDYYIANHGYWRQISKRMIEVDV